MDQTTPPLWFLLPDELGATIEPLLPPGQPHPVGCHRPRVDNRRPLDAIVFVFVAGTGCQWNALNDTGIRSSSSAHRRFQEWTAAGVFHRLCWHLTTYEASTGSGRRWTAR